jgi:predicted DNA-binding transcriptional regulator AlpA
MNNPKVSQLDEDLRLYSREDLTDAPEVTEMQAAHNRAIGRGLRSARPQRRGLLAMSEATFDRLVSSGDFPKPLRIGPRMVRWKASAVRKWLEKL